MADFCMQCSIELFNEDFEDFKGIGKGKNLPEGSGWSVLCEGCGMTLVDDEGKCILRDCLIYGNEVSISSKHKPT